MASTKQKLKNAIVKLVSEKDLDKISVDEIIRTAGVSRTIFYKLFQDKYALAFFVFEDDISSLVYDRYMEHGNYYQICYEVLTSFQNNIQFYKRLFQAKGGYISFCQWLTGYYVKMQGESIGKLRLSPEMQMLQYAYCAGVCMLEMRWVLGELPQETSAETLAKVIDRACPDELRLLLHCDGSSYRRD